MTTSASWAGPARVAPTGDQKRGVDSGVNCTTLNGCAAQINFCGDSDWELGFSQYSAPPSALPKRVCQRARPLVGLGYTQEMPHRPPALARPRRLSKRQSRIFTEAATRISVTTGRGTTASDLETLYAKDKQQHSKLSPADFAAFQ